MTGVLDRIIAEKRTEVLAARNALPMEQVRRMAEGRQMNKRPFEKTLRERVAGEQPAVIAEIKRASPSRGLLRADVNPAQLAREYQLAGATCLSVLTDSKFFQGSVEDLVLAREACDLPVLRKDFVIDLYQVYQSAALGADCILLVAACLDDALFKDLFQAALGLGLSVLPEVHTRGELERALSLGTKLLGINNRDLSSFKVSLSTTLGLLQHVPEGVVVVSESGITESSDVELMRSHSVHAFLVGERLMVSDRPGDTLRELFGDQPSLTKSM